VETFAGAMSAYIGRNQHQRAIAVKLIYAQGGNEVLECIVGQRKVMAALVQALRDAIPSAYDAREFDRSAPAEGIESEEDSALPLFAE
jgi:precorrin isomerase